jgi:hypothetical protein
MPTLSLSMKVLRKVERLDGTHLIRAIILMRTKSREQWKLYKPEFFGPWFESRWPTKTENPC